jgi:hypothetical protein
MTLTAAFEKILPRRAQTSTLAMRTYLSVRKSARHRFLANDPAM